MSVGREREEEEAAIGEFIARAVRNGDGSSFSATPAWVSCCRQPAANRDSLAKPVTLALTEPGGGQHPAAVAIT